MVESVPVLAEVKVMFNDQEYLAILPLKADNYNFEHWKLQIVDQIAEIK